MKLELTKPGQNERVLTPLCTARLILRQVQPADAAALFRYRALPEIWRYQSFVPSTVEDVAGFIAKTATEIDIEGSWFQLAVCRKNDGLLIGDIGLHFFEAEQVEIGYTLAPEQQGRGYGIEMLRAVLEHIFAVLKKHRVTASVDPANEQSIRLLKKAAMRQEGQFLKSVKIRGEWCDDCLFALLREEWLEKSSGSIDDAANQIDR